MVVKSLGKPPPAVRARSPADIFPGKRSYSKTKRQATERRAAPASPRLRETTAIMRTNRPVLLKGLNPQSSGCAFEHLPPIQRACPSAQTLPEASAGACSPNCSFPAPHVPPSPHNSDDAPSPPDIACGNEGRCNAAGWLFQLVTLITVGSSKPDVEPHHEILSWPKQGGILVAIHLSTSQPTSADAQHHLQGRPCGQRDSAEVAAAKSLAASDTVQEQQFAERQIEESWIQLSAAPSGSRFQQ